MKSIQLSIVTITYNDPEGLRATLQSLHRLVGSEISWELVIVDSSPEVNKLVLDADSSNLPLKIFVDKPSGIYPAMNLGISSSNGEFVWFLNSGDRLKDVPALESALHAFGSSPDRMIAQGAAELRHAGKFAYTQFPSVGLASTLGINRVCHQATLFRREIFVQLGKFSESLKLAADYEFLLRAHLRGIVPLAVKEVLVQYDMGGRSSEQNAVFKEFREIHLRLRAESGPMLYFAHSVVRELERARMGIFRGLARTPLAPLLRNLWQRYKRVQY